MKDKKDKKPAPATVKAPKADRRAITAANKARRIAKAAAQLNKALKTLHGATRKLRRESRIIVKYEINGVRHKRVYDREQESEARVRIAVLRGEGIHCEVTGLTEA